MFIIMFECVLKVCWFEKTSDQCFLSVVWFWSANVKKNNAPFIGMFVFIFTIMFEYVLKVCWVKKNIKLIF